MGERLGEISEALRADDRKQGGSLMRIHRDVRFSRDKSPYKTNVGIQFRHRAAKDVHAPGLYVHLAAEGCFIGSGTWAPERDELRGIRERIVEREDEWAEIRSRYEGGAWRLEGGESLKRAPKGFSAKHRHIVDLRRKWFVLVQDVETEQVLRPDFASWCVSEFAKTRPLLGFLCAALAVEF